VFPYMPSRQFSPPLSVYIVPVGTVARKSCRYRQDLRAQVLHCFPIYAVVYPHVRLAICASIMVTIDLDRHQRPWNNILPAR
jgi:hypothetical protein